MQSLAELIIGLIALLAAAVLSHFGVDLQASSQPEREVRRVSDCGDKPPASTVTAAVLVSSPSKRDC